jgi:hypothetical protein
MPDDGSASSSEIMSDSCGFGIAVYVGSFTLCWLVAEPQKVLLDWVLRLAAL